MFGLNYLIMVGIAAITGAIISIVIGLVLSTLTSLSPLIIGGIVGGISVVPLIATFIKEPLSEFAACNNRRISDFTLKEIACLAGLFIGSVVTGIGLVAYGITPITKLDSLSSLSTTANSLLTIGATALLFPIVAAILVGVAIKITEGVKKYISNKQTKPSEEDRPSQQIKPERLPGSELSEVSCDSIKDKQTTTANSPQ